MCNFQSLRSEYFIVVGAGCLLTPEHGRLEAVRNDCFFLSFPQFFPARSSGIIIHHLIIHHIILHHLIFHHLIYHLLHLIIHLLTNSFIISGDFVIIIRTKISISQCIKSLVLFPYKKIVSVLLFIVCLLKSLKNEYLRRKPYFLRFNI